jgi:hypothetical protein
MSVKHATSEPQQAAEWGQGINNNSGRKSKKVVDPNSEIAKLAAKKYEQERLKLRKILTMAVSQAHKDELAEFESQVFGDDLPSSFFSQNAKLDPANYGEMAMLPPSDVDFIEGDIEGGIEVIDLDNLDQYDLQTLRDRHNYLDDLDTLDESQVLEKELLRDYLLPRLEASNPCSDLSSDD